MSTVERTAKWIEQASDWANPILIKEIRQSLKSRQFVATFMLLLAASWSVSVFGLLIWADSIDVSSRGRDFFGIFYIVLTFAILIVVPFGAYRSLLTERDENTFDLLSITTLSPRQIVWGKLFSALLQVFIFYSGIAPFIAFSSLLQGFDLAQAAFLLVILMLVSLGFSMTALMLSTLARQKYMQTFMSLVLFGALLFGLFMFLNLTMGLVFSGFVPFDDPDFWWGLGIMLLFAASYFILFQQITTAQLTFVSDNRSTGIRVTCSAQFWLLWLVIAGSFWYSGSKLGHDEIMLAVVLSGIHWTAVGLFVSTEGLFVSRRVRRRLPQNPLLRFFVSPLMPGAGRGFLYVLLHVVGLWCVAGGVSTLIGSRVLSNKTIEFTTAVCCYIVIYVGLATALGRWGRALSS